MLFPAQMISVFRLIIAIGLFLLALATPIANARVEIKGGCNGDKRDLFSFNRIVVSGEIERGDAARIERSIRSCAMPLDYMYFNSPGGDPLEAVKIVDVVNKYFIRFRTGQCYYATDGGLDGCVGESDIDPSSPMTDKPDAICGSACALIFLAANERSGSEVYLHRFYFSQSYFSNLPAAAAEKAYEEATADLTAKLRKRGVPDDLIDAMMQIPSTGARRLGRDYPMYSPWLLEWLVAKCGENQFETCKASGGCARQTRSDAVVATSSGDWYRCSAHALAQERVRALGLRARH